MPTSLERREAVAAADLACPRCGAHRGSDQDYCLDCGLRLPPVHGAVPALRRRWLRHVGWYPGDWIWVSLLTLAIAVVGTAAAITVRHHRAGHHIKTIVATDALPARTRTAAPARASSTRSRKVRSGHFAWPANENGWTVVLSSYPAPGGRPTALAAAEQAAKAGLPQVGVLSSSDYASLTPGYDVVFTGVYGSQAQADSALAATRGAGYPGAYTREVAR